MSEWPTDMREILAKIKSERPVASEPNLVPITPTQRNIARRRAQRRDAALRHRILLKREIKRALEVVRQRIEGKKHVAENINAFINAHFGTSDSGPESRR